MENYMNNDENRSGLSQDSLVTLFLHTATKDDLESHKSEVARRFNEIDSRITDFKSDVDKRFDQIDKRFDQIDKRFDKFETRLMWGFGIVISVLIASHFF